jgi:putative ABC transport system permease protein
MIKDYLLLGIKNLRRRSLRSWLTMVGIFISIAIIFVLISLSLGLEAAMTEHIRTLGADKLFIYPNLQAGIPGASNPIHLSKSDADEVLKISGIKTLTYMSMENGKMIFSAQTRYFMILGFPLDKSALEVLYESSNLKLDEGKLLAEDDSRTILLGSEFKYGKLFDKPVLTGDSVELNNETFKVKGILASLGNPQDDKQVYLSIEDMKRIFGTGERVDYIIAQIQAGADVDDVASRIEKRLRAFRGVTEKTQDFSVVTPEELLRTIGTVLNIITAFLLGVAAISLVVGGIGIANTMYTAVLERRKEIGVMKAVGAKNSDILLIFLIESGLLGLVGGIIGVLIGMGIGKIIEYIAINYIRTTFLQVVFPYYLIIGCLVFAFIAGAVSGTFPAWQASQLKPVQSLRYE